MSADLESLAAEISKCRACDGKKIGVEHVAPMRRGMGTFGMIVGVGPGRTEVKSAEAFSGAAGKRLVSWLTGAGIANSREEIFKLFYMTSITKCRVVKAEDLSAAARACFPFLQRQLDLIQPKVLITLGAQPLQFLFGFTGKLDDLVGGVYVESNFSDTLFPLLKTNVPIVPLPHPSPRSRFTNEQSGKVKLQAAIGRIATLYAGEVG